MIYQGIAAVYTDGGVLGSSRSEVGGSWAWVGVDADGLLRAGEYGTLRPAVHGLDSITNNLSEFYAMLKALESMPAGWSGRVCPDSQVTLGRFFWSWKLAGVPAAWRQRMGAVIRRLGKLEPVLHDGHPTRAQLLAGVGKRGNPVSIHNVLADKLCGVALRDLVRTTDERVETIVVDECVTMTPADWRELLQGLPSVEFEITLAGVDPARPTGEESVDVPFRSPA